MSGPESYRDPYDGRGEYAKQNDAMLAAECARVLDWQNQTARPARLMFPQIGWGILIMASALAAGVYVFVIAASK